MESCVTIIDVESIMEQIRADIKARGLRDNDIEFENISVIDDDVVYSRQKYKNVVEVAAYKKHVLSYRPLHGNFITKFIKKVIRRCVAFYIESIVDDQNEFNQCVYESLKLNRSKLEEDTLKIESLEKRVSELEKKAGGKRE